LFWREIAPADLPNLTLARHSALVFLLESDHREKLKMNSAAIARRLLHHFTGNSAISIEKDVFGKPRINGAPLHVSISHSGSCLVLALATANVGVDIEYVRHPARWRSLYQWINSAEDSLCGASEIDFLECWTAKEALVKAIGCGLDEGLQSLSIPAVQSDAYRRVEFGASRFWLKPLPRWKEMAACLALEELSVIETFFLPDASQFFAPSSHAAN